MEYEEIVAAIAHIDAAQSIMGLDCPSNVTWETYRSLNEARNELNQARLEMLGNGAQPPYHVADLNLTS